ncbi:hypothetical protein NS383_19010 [Pseudomonas oryzihabitans]|nr:hypothetical protein NS383_19010 [Pseudomonas psychrotolerans]
MRVIATEYPVPVPPTAESPEGSFIEPAPADPVVVPDNAYFLRRITSGELTRVDEPVEAVATPTNEIQDATDANAKASRGAKATAKGAE